MSKSDKFVSLSSKYCRQHSKCPRKKHYLQQNANWTVDFSKVKHSNKEKRNKCVFIKCSLVLCGISNEKTDERAKRKTFIKVKFHVVCTKQLSDHNFVEFRFESAINADFIEKMSKWRINDYNSGNEFRRTSLERGVFEVCPDFNQTEFHSM